MSDLQITSKSLENHTSTLNDTRDDNSEQGTWDLDNEEKARRIAEEDLNQSKKQVCSDSPNMEPLNNLH
jgi:hypothetical protein